MADATLQAWVDRVHAARSTGTPLCLRGGGTKDFYGEDPQGELLDTTALQGISSYEPSELVVSARCGTPLAVLEATLAEQGQCLAFEPPHFAAGGTVGGMVAAGLSGPARASAGSLRDHVLGATLLNGRGEVLSFGGQVMKNVAGYDVSRLLCGSLGMLGVILEVSLKVMPVATATATLRLSLDQARALHKVNEWAGRALPLSASAWRDGALLLRLRGARAGVEAAARTLGGEPVDAQCAALLWRGLRDQSDGFFEAARLAVADGAALWRLSVPSATPPIDLSGETLIEWGGAQRWLTSTMPASQVRDAAARAGGHATLFRGVDKSAGVFSALPAPLERIHRELKKAFDPAGIFNPGRMYRTL